MAKPKGAARPDPRRNRLLAALPDGEYRALAAQLEPTPMPLGLAVYESGAPQGYVYFPTDSIVSLLYVLEDGASTEIAVTGNEGLVGISLFMGGETTPSRAVVQYAGAAWRIPADTLSEAFHEAGVLMDEILLYIQILYTQVAQTAVCNRHHNLQQQLSRWLLLSLDRMDTNVIAMTQELIAGMLGVRREGITRAAGELQKQHVIEYRRGSITVIDRHRLEKMCCECYEVVRQETERLCALQKSRARAGAKK